MQHFLFKYFNGFNVFDAAFNLNRNMNPIDRQNGNSFQVNSEKFFIIKKLLSVNMNDFMELKFQFNNELLIFY